MRFAGGMQMNNNEKLFRVIGNAGIWNLVMGIIVLITGITSGVLMLINAFRLIRSRHDLMI